MATALTSTTLSGAVSANATVLPVASATGISAPVNGIQQLLYVINPNSTKGQLFGVTGVASTQISVTPIGGPFSQGFISGAYVLIGLSPALMSQGVANPFQEFDPVGSVAAAAVQVTPWVNVTNGNQWLRSLDGLWVPGFNNPSPNKAVTTAVASAAGVTSVTGPLFHVTGTNAITGWTLPVGFTGGSFTVIPDAVFTWTAAGNIGLAGTAVVGKALTFTWDSNAGKFYPSYIA